MPRLFSGLMALLVLAPFAAWGLVERPPVEEQRFEESLESRAKRTQELLLQQELNRKRQLEQRKAMADQLTNIRKPAESAVNAAPTAAAFAPAKPASPSVLDREITWQEKGLILGALLMLGLVAVVIFQLRKEALRYRERQRLKALQTQRSGRLTRTNSN